LSDKGEMSASLLAAATPADVCLHEQQVLKMTAAGGNSQTVDGTEAEDDTEVHGKPK